MVNGSSRARWDTQIHRQARGDPLASKHQQVARAGRRLLAADEKEGDHGPEKYSVVSVGTLGAVPSPGRNWSPYRSARIPPIRYGRRGGLHGRDGWTAGVALQS